MYWTRISAVVKGLELKSILAILEGTNWAWLGRKLNLPVNLFSHRHLPLSMQSAEVQAAAQEERKQRRARSGFGDMAAVAKAADAKYAAKKKKYEEETGEKYMPAVHIKDENLYEALLDCDLFSGLK